MELTVSQLAEQVRVSADTVRYYEKVGLIPPPYRNSAGYRIYGEDMIERLRFVRGVQRFGLRLREVGELLEVIDRGSCPCGHAQAIVENRIDEIDAELAELSEVRRRLGDLAKEVRSPRRQDPRTGQWPCQRQFIDVGPVEGG